MLGFRSVKGTSTVIFTRLGLNCSTVLGTLLTPVMVRDKGRPKLSVRKPRQSYGDARVDPKPSREPPGGQARTGPARHWLLHRGCPTLDHRTPGQAGRIRGVA